MQKQTMTVIDYVDGVQGLSLATQKFEQRHRECSAELMIIGDGINLLQPATDANAFKCEGCGKPIPIIRRNMPGYRVPGYDRVGTGPVDRQDPPDQDWAPFLRLFNHVREQLPGWIEQIADLLNGGMSIFRSRGAKIQARSI